MNKIRFTAMAMLVLAASAAQAQGTASGFFNDGYMYRHNINPAVGNRQSYFAIPVLGNVCLSARSTVGVGDFVYSQKGQTVSFMHPSVDVDKAVRPFEKDLRLEQDMRLDLLSMGFAGKWGRGYTTVSLGVRQHASLSLPGQLFRAAKEGLSNDTYDLSAISAHADAFGELAIGHSRRIGEHLEVGGKLKLLIGGANVDATAKGTQLNLGEDAWTATVDAEVQASVKGLSFTSDTEMRGPEGQQTPHTFIDGLDFDSPGINGFGAALDLGAVYTFGEDLKLGVAVLDLGGIQWSNNLLASTGGPHTVNTDKYVFSVDDEDDNSFENEFERLGDAAAELYELKDMGDQGSRFAMLGATLNASLEYKLPFYRRLSVGVLSTTRFQGDRTWNEERFSLNLAPFNWFAVSVTAAAGTFGPSYGGMVSLHPKGFSIYAGADCLGAPYDKNGIPLGRGGLQANVGLVVPF